MSEAISIKNNKINIKYIIISLFFAILAISTIILVEYGKDSKKIIISSENNKEIQISEVILGGTKYPLNNFVADGITYNEEYNFLSVSPSTEMTLTTSAIEDVSITFIKNEDNAKVKVKSQEDTQIIETNSKDVDFVTYTNSKTIKEILYNQIKNLNKKNIIKYSITFIILLIAIFFILKYVVKFMKLLSESKNKWYQLLLFIGCVAFLFQCSIYILLEIFNFLIIIPEAILLIYIIIKNKELFKKVENIFLIFAIFIGLNIAFILPPFNVPDERAHYLRAYNIAQSPSEVKKYVIDNHKNSAKISIPSTINYTMYEYNIDIHSIDYKLSAKKILAHYSLKIEENKDERVLLGFGNTSTLNPFCYIFTAIAIGICRLFNTSVIFSTILGRLFNLSIFIIGMYYSIKNIPIFKKTLMVVGLLPITLQQAAAFNQDSITNTLIFIIFSLIIKLICDKGKIKNKEIGLLYILGILLSFCKLVYFPILFLTLIIPPERFKNKKTKYFIIAGLIISNFILTVIGIFGMSGGNTVAYSQFYTISTVLHHPLTTIKIFINTFLERANLDLLGGLVNGFGWSTKWGKNFFTFIIQTIFLILYLMPDNKFDKKIKKPAIIITILSGILIFGFVYSSLLVGYTPIYSSMVAGLQSRYFIPVLLLLLCVIPEDLIKIKMKDKNTFYSICFIISFMITIFTITEGFYV